MSEVSHYGIRPSPYSSGKPYIITPAPLAGTCDACGPGRPHLPISRNTQRHYVIQHPLLASHQKLSLASLTVHSWSPTFPLGLIKYPSINLSDHLYSFLPSDGHTLHLLCVWSHLPFLRGADTAPSHPQHRGQALSLPPLSGQLCHLFWGEVNQPMSNLHVWHASPSPWDYF